MGKAFWTAFFLVGLLFWVYWGGSRWLVRPDQVKHTRHHESLFAHACLFIFLTPFLLLLGCALIPALVLSGYYGWAVLINVWRIERAKRTAYWESHSIGPLQFRLTDLFTTVVYLGAVLAAFSLILGGNTGYEEQMVCLAVFLLVTGVFALLVSADLLRRMPPAQTDNARPWRILAILMSFTITLGVGGVLAWLVWRRAMFLLDYKAWRKEKQADELKSAIREATEQTTTAENANPAETPGTP